MPNPRALVPGPTYAPAPFGLLSVAQVVDDPDPHWRNGIKWEATCSPSASTTISPCSEVVDPAAAPDGRRAATPPVKSGDRGVPQAEGPAVTLYATHECAVVGRTQQADLDRAGMLLTNGESRALESVLYTGETEAGTLPENLQALAEPALGVAGASGLAHALGLLEDDLAQNYGGLGVIHATRGLALALVGERLAQRSTNGARLETVLGTPISAGGGYGTGTRLYATGAVVVYRGAPSAYPGVDRAVNTSHVIVERTYAYGWDCLASYADVDLSAATLSPPI